MNTEPENESEPTFPYTPPAIERRSVVLGIKLTKAEREELQRRSGAQNRGELSDWVRRAIFAYKPQEEAVTN